MDVQGDRLRRGPPPRNTNPPAWRSSHQGSSQTPAICLKTQLHWHCCGLPRLSSLLGQTNSVFHKHPTLLRRVREYDWDRTFFKSIPAQNMAAIGCRAPGPCVTLTSYMHP